MFMDKRAVAAATLLCFSVSLATPCYADDPAPIVTPLKKGQLAPYAGVLMDPLAVAKTIAAAQECDSRVKVESDNAAAVQKANDDKALADAQADAAQQKAVAQAGLHSRDAQIKALTQSLQQAESSQKSNWLWLVGGAVGGVLLTVGAVLAVGFATSKL